MRIFSITHRPTGKVVEVNSVTSVCIQERWSLTDCDVTVCEDDDSEQEETLVG